MVFYNMILLVALTMGVCNAHDPHATTVGYTKAIINGDPHISTFDDLHYAFQGPCTYLITAPCNQSQACSVSSTSGTANPHFEVVGRFIANSDVTRPTSRLYYIIVNLYYEDHPRRIILGPEIAQIRICPENYEDWTTMSDCPVVTAPLTNIAGLPGVQIQTQSIETILRSDWGLHVYFTKGAVEICLPSGDDDYAGKLCGLAGNMNGNRHDDVYVDGAPGKTTPRRDFYTGLIKQDPTEFGNSHLLLTPKYTNPERCDILETNIGCTTQQYTTLKEHCQLLDASDVNSPFHFCLQVYLASSDGKYTDTKHLIDDCIYDGCNTADPHTGICDYLDAIRLICYEMDICVQPWRNQTGCYMKCPGNSTYEADTSACPNTCAYPRAGFGPCTHSNIDDCVCDPGFIKAGTKCVKEGKCGCIGGPYGYMDRSTFGLERKCAKRTDCSEAGVKSVNLTYTCPIGTVCQRVWGKDECLPEDL